MKKIFTLFIAALVYLFSYADASCPSALNLALLNGENPSQVEIEVQLVNSSPHLYGFVLVLEKVEGSENIQWKKTSGRKYFSVDDYLNVVFANTEIPTDGHYTLDDYLDLKSNLYNDKLIIKYLLWSPTGLFFPILEEPTGIGKFYLDMSACEDGYYEILGAKDPNSDGSLLYRSPNDPEGHSFNCSYWSINEPMHLTLSKQGNSVIEVSCSPATYVSELSGINTVVTDKADNRIFDLQGRELQSAPEHGIYIQNGKKYVK